MALIAIAVVHYYSVYRAERVGTETAERVGVELVRQVLVADLASVVTDLLVLARHVEQMALAEDALPAPQLERVFVIFAEQKRLYDQIRYIDTRGQETLRVDLREGRAHTIPLSQLQDKSGRYYVSAAQHLTPGAVYISPLDLNVEQGEIERPFKPVMRFATRVFDAQGRPAGILVLNYLGQRLLDGVLRAAGTMSGHLHLLEPRGFWLMAPNPADAWGFMLGHRSSFATRFPREWDEIRTQDKGRLVDANGMFTFATVSPLQVVDAATRGRLKDISLIEPSADDSYTWKVVSRLPLGALAPPPGTFISGNAPLYGALVGLFALGSFLLARSRVRHHQAELQSEYERRFRRTLEDIDLVAVALDRSGRITFCNRFFLALTDWGRGQVVGSAWLERFTPEQERERMSQLLATLDVPEHFPSRFTCEVLTRCGEHRLIAWHNSLNTNADGRPIGVTAIGEDITDKQRNEAAVRKLGQAVEQSPSIVTITDPSGRIEYVNPKFTEVTGYALDEVLGRNPRVLKSGETPSSEYRELWRIVTGGGVWHGEFHNRRKNGELYWEAAAISALRDGEGRITHYLAVKEDITERKRLEQEVEVRNRELARTQALAEVGRMATMIAHDLRNPLSSVKVTLQILSKPGTPEEEADELRTIAREQVSYMEAILADMLTYARPQAPALEWLDAERLLDTVLGLAQGRLDEQGVHAVTEYRSGLPTFPGDPNQLRQVFSNLIANAAQATEEQPAGQRQILVRTDMELAEEGTRIRVEICDNGCGIPEDAAERLFEPFFTTRAKGTGLGLAIVQKLLVAHGGGVELTPHKPRGTCCRVLLPTIPVVQEGPRA